MKSGVSVILLSSTTYLLLLLSIYISCTVGQIRFSVCDGEDGYGEQCINLGTIAHCDSKPRKSASVQGMWVFTENDVLNTEGEGLGEFLYQETIGVPYHTFKQVKLDNGGCWRRIGYIEDYKTNALSLYRVTGLLSDSTSIIKENQGNTSFCLDKAYGVIKSFAILGNSSWILTTKNNDSICLSLKDTTSFIPGLVMDINELGIQHGELCSAAVKESCDGKTKLVTIDNTIKNGILRRAK